MTKLKSLWNIWFLGFLSVSNVYLVYSTIVKYLEFKYHTNDPAYGLNWNLNLCYIVLGPLILALSLLPLILYLSIVYNGNLSDDGQVLHDNCAYMEFLLTSKQHGIILPVADSIFCIKNRVAKLLFMEMPSPSYLLQVVVALCYLIPIPFIEAQYVLHGVVKSNRVWHTDLDQLFQPDTQHPQFTFFGHWNYEQPLSVGFINLALSLIALTVHYTRVFWATNRLFTCVFSGVLFLASIHLLLDYCCLCVVVKLAVNSVYFLEKFHVQSSPYNFAFLFFLGNIAMLVSMTTVFHYGVLQYADAFTSRFHRQNQLGSPINNATNNNLQPSNNNNINNNTNSTTTNNKTGTLPHANAALLSPCNSISEHNCASGCHNIEMVGPQQQDHTNKPIFSRSNKVNLVAVLALIVVSVLKFHNFYWQFRAVYDTLQDSLMLTNLVLACLLALVWALLWFAFGLRKTWNFKITPASTTNRTSDYYLPSNARSTNLIMSNNIPYSGGANNNNNGHYSMIPGQQQTSANFTTGSLSRTPYLLNGTPLGSSQGATYYLHNSGNLMKASDLAMHQLNQQGRAPTNGMDAFSDDDLSSRISSNNNNNSGGGGGGNNYVLMQSVRPHNNPNMVMNHFDTIQSHTGSQNSHNIARNPIYLSYTNNNAALAPASQQPIIFHEETSHNPSQPIRSQLADDSLGSEHSFNSGRSPINSNPLPPLLPNFDESRYRSINTNMAAMDKLIPRYLRNVSSLDGGSVQLFPNDLLMMSSPATGPLDHLQPLLQQQQQQQQGISNKSTSGGHRFGSPLSNGHQQHRMTHNLYEENSGEVHPTGILTPDLNLLPSLHSSQDTNLHRLSIDLPPSSSVPSSIQPASAKVQSSLPANTSTAATTNTATTNVPLDNSAGSIISSNETNSNISGNQGDNSHQNLHNNETLTTVPSKKDPDNSSVMATQPIPEQPNADTNNQNTNTASSTVADRMCSQV